MYNLPYTNKQINIPYLLKIGNGKIYKIGKYLKDKNLPGVALFLGDGTEELVGAELRRGFGDNDINVVHSQVVSDISIESITQTAFQLPPATDVVVGIGGGKALDFAKYSAHLLRLPFVSVPTSTSNDGFCSPTSSLTVGGRRKTVKSSIPFGVVIDLDVIRSCPPVFFYSGLGDMVSKITALADWKEAANRKLERYSDFASMLAYNSLDLLFIKHSTQPDHVAADERHIHGSGRNLAPRQRFGTSCFARSGRSLCPAANAWFAGRYRRLSLCASAK